MEEYERAERAQEDAALLLKHIEESDAILVGAAAGMTTAAGHRFYYERDPVFVSVFGEFERKYGFHNTFDGFYYRYPSSEERWAFIAASIKNLMDLPEGQAYRDLATLLEGKAYHVLTTNQDTLFERVVSPDKISAIQGDWRYFQCSGPCHDGLYRNEEMVINMCDAIRGTSIPAELIPRCPECGEEMEPWVRGWSFLEGEKYRQEHAKVNSFLIENKDEKLLFLELGVGRMTPMFIQQPFWDLAYALPHAFYISINPKDACMPPELNGKGALIHEDIAVILRKAVQAKERGCDRDGK